MRPDDPQYSALDTLLSLDGEVFRMDNGYWVKFEARRVAASTQLPHGIRYSLTLHNRDNKRVLGFDNAHAVKPVRKRFGARKATWDHKHRKDDIAAYEFETPGQLLEDFWQEAERVMAERRKSDAG